MGIRYINADPNLNFARPTGFVYPTGLSNVGDAANGPSSVDYVVVAGGGGGGTSAAAGAAGAAADRWLHAGRAPTRATGPAGRRPWPVSRCPRLLPSSRGKPARTEQIGRAHV